MVAKQVSKIHLTPFLILIFAIGLILFPQDVFDASLAGLNLWFEIVLPSLLPFFIVAELLMSLGAVHFIGALFEPLMYPLFRIPGSGAFALSMGLASGYPMGAKITADLRRKNICSKVEAERLISFAHTAGPLFIAGAVAVGMFAQPGVAVTLFIAHYLAAIIVGILMRFHGGKKNILQPKIQRRNRFNYALNLMTEARNEARQQSGTLFNLAVNKAFKSLVFIGGCIMIFSVLARLLMISGITPMVATILAPLFNLLNLGTDTIHASIASIIEVDIGIAALSKTGATLEQKLIITSAILGWSGISVHAQVAAMIQGTDISIKPYLFARILHGLIASIIAFFTLKPTQIIGSLISIPAFSLPSLGQSQFLLTLGITTKIALAMFLFFALLIIMAFVINRLIIFYVKQKS